MIFLFHIILRQCRLEITLNVVSSWFEQVPSHAFAICTTSSIFAAVFLNTKKAIATEQIHSNIQRASALFKSVLLGTCAMKQYL